MENEFIYTSGYGKRLTFNESNQLLKDKKPNLLKLFPGLRDGEKGYFCDKLFTKAVKPVVKPFWAAQDGWVTGKSPEREQVDVDAIKGA